MARIHNFNAGPAAMPLEVLEQAQSQLPDLAGSGLSVMEMSHRSREFQAIIDGAESRIRRLMKVPEDYAVLRHVPVAPDTFAFYADDLLPNFAALPTWKFATPHNINRDTAQNASCDACHGNDEIFLTEEDLAPGEIEANQGVILNGAP